MDIIEESTQDTILDSQVSQDLFADVVPNYDNPAQVNPSDIKEILKELRNLRAEVAELKSLMKQPNQTFQMSACSFKDTLHHFLRNLFTKTLWLKVKDEEFQAEVKKCLANEGFGTDSSAFRKVCSFSYVKFTEFRSQLKRSLTMKTRKTDLRGLNLNEFCKAIFEPFCRAGENVCSQERRHNALLIRTFMYRQKVFTLDAAQMPTSALSWEDFKAFHDTHDSQGNSERRQKMEENDGKRRSRFLSAREATQSEK